MSCSRDKGSLSVVSYTEDETCFGVGFWLGVWSVGLGGMGTKRKLLRGLGLKVYGVCVYIYIYIYINEGFQKLGGIPLWRVLITRIILFRVLLGGPYRPDLGLRM